METLSVSFSLLTEDQDLAENDLSAILGPFDSNHFMLCPQAMSFFQKLCPTLPPSLLLHNHYSPSIYLALMFQQWLHYYFPDSLIST